MEDESAGGGVEQDSSYATTIMDQLESGSLTTAEAEAISRNFLDTLSDRSGVENGLLSYSLVLGLGGLPSDVAEGLTDVFIQAIGQEPVVKRTLERAQPLTLAVDNLFDDGNHTEGFLQVSHIDDPLAMRALALTVQKKAEQNIGLEGRKVQSGEGLIVEPVTNPVTHESGIWMSTQGNNFKPKELKPSSH